jgi:hypothetical protein
MNISPSLALLPVCLLALVSCSATQTMGAPEPGSWTAVGEVTANNFGELSELGPVNDMFTQPVDTGTFTITVPGDQPGEGEYYTTKTSYDGANRYTHVSTDETEKYEYETADRTCEAELAPGSPEPAASDWNCGTLTVSDDLYEIVSQSVWPYYSPESALISGVDNGLLSVQGNALKVDYSDAGDEPLGDIQYFPSDNTVVATISEDGRSTTISYNAETTAPANVPSA